MSETSKTFQGRPEVSESLRQLDAEVAEHIMNIRCSGNRTPDHDTWCSRHGTGKTVGAPFYSSDIGCAMEVVNVMWQIGWQIESANGYKVNTFVADNICSWWVRFINNENDMNNWSATADSLPEAICRAAIAAIRHVPEVIE